MYYTYYERKYLFLFYGVKPIFHCNAKYLASGVGVGQSPRRQNFALEIPTCWYILALPNAKICVAPDAKPKIYVIADANPQRQSVEYGLRWAFWRWGWRWACTFHVFCWRWACTFHLRFVANANPVSSGIWASHFDRPKSIETMNLKLIFSLLFFEHRYLNYYLCY